MNEPNPDLVINDLTTLERFWSKIPALPENECWMWQAGTMPRGYGFFRVNGKTRLAHRVMYRLKKGEIPDDMMVCHTCDTPGCVNPNHHFLGTSKDNQQDMKNKGRSTLGDRHWTRHHAERIAFGEKNGMAKIDEDTVLKIRKMYADGWGSQQAIGNALGLSQTHVGRIVRGERWSASK